MILFFGASVTHQAGSAGYFNFLNNFSAGDVSFSRLSFPACHFNDAGFIFHDKVLDINPSVCVLEWNTTGVDFFDEKKLLCVLQNFFQAGIMPAFLILPRSDTNMYQDRKAERQVLEVCEKYKLPILDLRPFVDIDLHLRDNVHTNAFGAKFYAELIGSWLYEFYPHKYNFGENLNLIKPYFDPALLVNSFVMKDFKNIAYSEVSLSCEKSCNDFELFIEGNIGPFSPLVLIEVDGRNFGVFSFWDRWCHYERYMVHSILKFSSHELLGNFNIKLTILSELPDYASCAKEFQFPIEKYLNIKSFSSLGFIINDCRFC
jgi:hypothetical protein